MILKYIGPFMTITEGGEAPVELGEVYDEEIWLWDPDAGWVNWGPIVQADWVETYLAELPKPIGQYLFNTCPFSINLDLLGVD